MAIKKSELYSSIWESCNKLCGGLDSTQYKDYVLSILFVKYVSDKYYRKEDALIEVPKGGCFENIVALKGKTNIGEGINKIIDKLACTGHGVPGALLTGEGINKIIDKLAEANNLKGVINIADFNDSEKLGKDKEKVERLSDLVAIFENEDLNFKNNRAEDDDMLGDTYEFLMRKFATESGKSKGQFYTPAEVSRIMAKVIGIEKATSSMQTLYDPTCGSGSLLIRAADETEEDVTIYGQEIDLTTKALAKMNTILHAKESAEIMQGNTLSNPLFIEDNGKLKRFDFCVANPPFSYKSWRNGFSPENDEYNRFEYGIPPAKNGDYAFLLHFLASMKSTGKGAIIMPHGVLFRGNVEGEIRKRIIQHGYIKGIIGLPANLFYGTGIPACIIVLDKENAQSRKGIFMIDASKGYFKDGNKNRFRHQDIHRIVDVFNNQTEIDKYSRMVSFAEIEENGYNLNIPRYIDSSEEEDIQDIDAHLKGGIPDKDIENLNRYWGVYPTMKNALFVKTDREGYNRLKIEKDKIQNTIFEHSEFKSYSKKVHKAFEYWVGSNKPKLNDLKQGVKPRQIIKVISEDILKTFTDTVLIDKYDVYQHLMEYWSETMQDDVYMISENGWKAELYKEGSGKKIEYKCDLIPKELVASHYFSDDKKHIKNLEANLDTVSQEMQELVEEHSGDEGLLNEVINDKGNITKGGLQKRIKELEKTHEDDEELEILKKYRELTENGKKVKDEIKSAEQKLNNNVLRMYAELTPDKVKELVVDYKWLPAIYESLDNEMQRISRNLTKRIKELAERYSDTLPALEDKVDELTAKVEPHLEKMGFSC